MSKIRQIIANMDKTNESKKVVMSKKVVVVFRKLQSHNPVVTTVTEIPTFSDDSDSREREFALKTLSDTRVSVCARFVEFNDALWTFAIYPVLQ